MNDIKRICIEILMDYGKNFEGITKEELEKAYDSIPLMYPTCCAAILFVHKEYDTERACILREFLSK